ncbi:MAG: sensor histidine kinase [Acutalibacteraceae bacterium]
MATKSKNIKYGRGTKLAALVIAAVMFFASGCFASRFVKGVAMYNSYSPGTDYTQTTAFRGLMSESELYIIPVAEYLNVNTRSDYLNTPEGKEITERYQKLIDKVTEAYSLLDGSGIAVSIDGENRYRYSLEYNGKTYYFSHDGTIISFEEFNSYDYVDYYGDSEADASEDEPVTAVAVSEPVTRIIGGETAQDTTLVVEWDGAVPAFVRQISKALNCVDNASSYEHFCYGETSLEQTVEQINNSKESEINANYNTWDNVIAKNIISANELSFAVFFGSGEVVTNCGITAEDTEEQIIKKLGSETFAEGYMNGEYKLLVGKPVPSDKASIYSKLHDSLFKFTDKSGLQRYGFEETVIKGAYFGLRSVDNTSGLFNLSKTAYDSFNRGSVFSPSKCLALFAIFFLIACAACIYLLSAAGKTADGIRINFFDKIPLVLNWAVGLTLMFCIGAVATCFVVWEFAPSSLIYSLGSSVYNDGFMSFMLSAAAKTSTVCTALCVALFFLIWTGLNMSMARNIRNKSFFKHTLCYWLILPFRWLWKKTKQLFACDYSDGRRKKFRVIASISVTSFLIINGIMLLIAGDNINYGSGVFLTLFMIAVNLAVLGFCIVLIVSLDKIMAATSDIRKGNMNRRINTDLMPGFLRRFSADILSMSDGLQKAVDNATKDQRMKAELITNVSHDLKTPLTSIVNYVDLLKKCNVEDETAQKYISVLDEKAAKMKKLIEDLVEASKASSGAVEIHPVKLNLCEFATQAVGEHEDELRKYGIELVLKLPENPVMVNADAQKTSRIVENLISNIRKYALEGTRVYIDVAEGTDFGSLVFKNISKNPLDISPEELTQRFVRGDSARTGEGSGLGLSIAKDLCELQGGMLGLQIDGDLFKATIALPKAK